MKGKRVRLLLMDEDAFFRKDIAGHLKSKGYDVATAETGRETIEWVSANRFDLVITCLKGGTVDGIAILKSAKKSNPETMVIIVTAQGDMNSAIEALRQDADDYILKPCNGEEIHYRIEKCMEKQKIKRKVALYENLLSVCGKCKKIKEAGMKKGVPEEWVSVENYIQKRAHLKMKSTYCPECAADFAELGIDIGVDADLCIDLETLKDALP